MKIYAPQITGSLAINGTSIGNFNNLVSTSSFNQYTSSISTGSLATTGSNTFVGNQTMSGSIIPAVTNTYDLGDVSHQFRHLYLSSGSLYINGTKVLGATGQELQITTDNGQSLKILEAGSDTITLQSADGNITLATSGGGDVILDPTSGIIALKGTTTLYAGNKILSSDGGAIQVGNDLGITGSLVTTGNINGINLTTFSSSIASTLLNQNTATSSYETKGSGIVSGSSQITPLLPTGTISGSSQITYTSISSIPSGIVSGSSQTIANLPTGVVSGSSQVTTLLPTGTVSGSSQILGGSGLVSGSSQVTYTSVSSIPGGIVSGSSQITTLLPTGVISGSSQLNNASIENLTVINLTTVNETASVIFSSGSNRFGDFGDDIHNFTGSVQVTGSFTLVGSSTATSYNGIINATNGVVSGSSQITYANISSIPGGIVSGSSQTIANLPTGTVSGSSQIIYTNISSIPAGIVSGSSQITYASVSSIPAGIVSGSSQVDVMSTTNIAKLATTGSNTFNANQIISGSLSILGPNATGTFFNAQNLGAGGATFTRVSASSYPYNHYIFNNGNVGIGITPQGAGTANTLEIGSRGIIYDNNDNFLYGNNGWVDAGTWKYKQTGYACIMATNGGQFSFSTAGSGTQNGAITWSDKFVIANNGNVSINTSGAGLLTLGASTSYGSVSSGGGGATIYLNGATRGGTTTAASNTIVVATDGDFYITNGAANSTKFLVGSTGIVTTGVIKGDSGADYPHSFTNTDAGNTHWTNRGGRLLTSNGTNWVGDGKDPIMALVGSTASTVRGQMIGLALHNDNNTTNAFSPMIAFSALSNSNSFNSLYASIMGKKTGTGSGLDTNWNKGELHFYAHGDSYVADTPNFLLSSTAATFSGTITESSSLRYKENVETIKYGLDKVLQMRGVTYDKKDNGVKELGVIAEEVYDILPEVVLKNEEGEIDSVSYGRIVGVLIEAIKEQQKQIEELKSLIK